MNTLPPISNAIWDSKYRLKELDGTPVDQTIDGTWRRVATALAQAEKEHIRPAAFESFLRVMASGEWSPAGRIIAGAGSSRNVTLSNCYTMGQIPDSMDGIFSHLKEAALTMQAGGGIGYDFSTLRPKGAPVKGVGADASGPLSFMDVWDAMCRTVMSAGSRRGAMMATMRCDHPDIEAFIEAKHDPLKLRMFNLSVLITDDFMAAVKDDLEWRLHFENRHGETIAEKTISARSLWEKIMRSTYAYAEPGVIFIDRINRDHNLGYLETVATTNPCGEKPMGPYASCLLGSINLAKMVHNAFTPGATISMTRLREVVSVAIRAMDNVIDVGLFPLEEQRKKAYADRQLGLGVTGLADALIMCNMTYGSFEAVRLTEEIMREIAITAYRTSMELAKEKGAFPTFDAEEFLSPLRFAGRMLPVELKDEIRKHGIRNGLLLSVAPTGTISLFAGNVSSGIEPVFALAYERKVLQPDGTRTIEPVEDFAVAAYRKFWLKNRTRPETWSTDLLPRQFVTAQTLDPMDHVRMQAAAQKWVDSSISKTVNCPEDISFEDFQNIYMTAYEMGCKGCTTYRPNDVTGSVLTATDTKSEASLDDIKRITNGWLRVPDEAAQEARRRGLRKWLDEKGFLNVSSVPKSLWFELLDFQKTFPVADFSPSVEDETQTAHFRVLDAEGATIIDGMADDFEIEDWPEGDGFTVTATLKDAALPTPYDTSDGPQERPDALPGQTYKVKWPGSEHAIYVNVTDIVDPRTGQRRPFELFINSKNMEHFAWTVALTRMVSAIFRRPHDSRFVVEELKAVFDPKGGAWVNGSYVPSVLAAIGNVIEEHMRLIGYMEPKVKAARSVPPAPPEPAEVVPVNTDRAQLQALGRIPEHCPKCSSFNVKVENGCPTCLDCGHSKCG